MNKVLAIALSSLATVAGAGLLYAGHAGAGIALLLATLGFDLWFVASLQHERARDAKR